jgi:hypothetical protein
MDEDSLVTDPVVSRISSAEPSNSALLTNFDKVLFVSYLKHRLYNTKTEPGKYLV